MEAAGRIGLGGLFSARSASSVLNGLVWRREWFDAQRVLRVHLSRAKKRPARESRPGIGRRGSETPPYI